MSFELQMTVRSIYKCFLGISIELIDSDIIDRKLDLLEIESFHIPKNSYNREGLM